MQNERVAGIARKLNEAGIPPDFGPDRSRLLIQVWRLLAKGSPVTGEQVDRVITDLGVPTEDGHQFLREVSEWDAEDNIVGIIGLSLNDEWKHRFQVNGVSLRTWCAWDALFLPPMLKETVTIESVSPGTEETIRLRVSPERVEEANPTGASVTLVALDPDKHDLSSVEAVWGTFCHQVYFFPSRDEAEQWAVGREDIVILSVADAYEVGKQAFSTLLVYA